MFAGHVLAVVDDGSVVSFEMKQPGSKYNDIIITSTPRGVILQYAPSGAMSSMELSDFVSEMEPNYLATKFLQPKWSPEAARSHLDSLIQDLTQLGRDGIDEGYEMAEELRTRKHAFSGIFDSPAEWQKHLGDLLGDMIHGAGQFSDPLIDESEAYPPLAYDQEEVGKLTAIHDRFRKLFLKTMRLEQGRPVPR